MKIVELIRGFIRALLNRFAAFLNKFSFGKITPNSITFTSLIGHFPIAFLVASRHNYWAAGVLFVFGLLDAVDGPLARLQNKSDPVGMLLDSVTDKIKEVMIYVGAAFSFVAIGRPYYAVWAVAACGVSLLVSYVNAWGEAMVANRKLKGHVTNNTFRTGLMTYDVRMTVFWFGLLSNQLAVTIVFIAVVSLFTALGRAKTIFHIIK